VGWRTTFRVTGRRRPKAEANWQAPLASGPVHAAVRRLGYWCAVDSKPTHLVASLGAWTDRQPWMKQRIEPLPILRRAKHGQFFEVAVIPNVNCHKFEKRRLAEANWPSSNVQFLTLPTDGHDTWNRVKPSEKGRLITRRVVVHRRFPHQCCHVSRLTFAMRGRAPASAAPLVNGPLDGVVVRGAV